MKMESHKKMFNKKKANDDITVSERSEEDTMQSVSPR